MSISISEDLYYFCKMLTLQKAKPRMHGTSLLSSLQPPMNLSYDRIKIKKFRRADKGKAIKAEETRGWKSNCKTSTKDMETRLVC